MRGIIHFTTHPDVEHTAPASRANQITEDYYNFLVGKINRGTIKKSVCSIFYPQYNYTEYFLLSV